MVAAANGGISDGGGGGGVKCLSVTLLLFDQVYSTTISFNTGLSTDPPGFGAYLAPPMYICMPDVGFCQLIRC